MEDNCLTMLYWFLLDINMNQPQVYLCFLVAQTVKNHSSSGGDLGSIPGSGRSPGEGNGSPLQYFCLENSMDIGALWATVHRVTESWTRLEWLSTRTHLPLELPFHPHPTPPPGLSQNTGFSSLCYIAVCSCRFYTWKCICFHAVVVAWLTRMFIFAALHGTPLPADSYTEIFSRSPVMMLKTTVVIIIIIITNDIQLNTSTWLALC